MKTSQVGASIGATFSSPITNCATIVIYKLVIIGTIDSDTPPEQATLVSTQSACIQVWHKD